MDKRSNGNSYLNEIIFGPLGQAAFVLQDARKQLRYVHQDFQAWQAAVSVTVIRKCWDKYSNRQMSFHEIKRELEGMAMKIKQPSSSPSIDPSEMPKKQDCSRECITNTQFLHFSRGQSLQCPEIRRSVVPVRTESQRISAASETDSGLSASPPSQMSSWLESDLSSYTSSSEVPLAQFTENSMCNYRVPPRRMGSPISPVLLQAACTWVEDSSISENDTEDISEVFFNSVRINRNQPSWAAMVDETTNTLISNSSLVDEVGEIGFQDFPAVITGEGNPHFWQNILNLASITDRTD
ncbi:unnamed protein product [Allacma fusca]|uniref:Uncharacterized protein n=1 Tax=Allacma fusca TaxID=39272 RepID=A0A8J2PNB6_9HEXA|nr:unnamed protein product [Allacma fusca]